MESLPTVTLQPDLNLNNRILSAFSIASLSHSQLSMGNKRSNVPGPELTAAQTVLNPFALREPHGIGRERGQGFPVGSLKGFEV